MRTVKRLLMGGGIVAGVVVALVVAALVGMLVGAGGISAGGGTVSVAPGPSPTPTRSPSPSPSPTPSPYVTARPLVLFVGDSYTVGQRASSREKRWSTLVAREMGWIERNVAEGGTGFVSRYPNRDLLSYEEQLRAVRHREGIDVVVIAGGQNDFDELRSEPAAVFRAVEKTYEVAARLYPDAEIIAVGPSTPWEVGLEARALDSAVRAAAEEQGATYVSMIDPNVMRGRYVDPDGIHVNDKGYAAIADRVISQIS
jgi:lysophospholipase L1-like esterase